MDFSHAARTFLGLWSLAHSFDVMNRSERVTVPLSKQDLRALNVIVLASVLITGPGAYLADFCFILVNLCAVQMSVAAFDRIADTPANLSFL